jgi:hypothetical protein
MEEGTGMMTTYHAVSISLSSAVFWSTGLSVDDTTQTSTARTHAHVHATRWFKILHNNVSKAA